MRVYYHVRRQQIVTRDRVAVSVPPARAGVPPTAQNRARVAEGQRRVQVEMHHAEPPIDVQHDAFRLALDRKSTRLNSSHVESSYAVFCLKKKRIVWK